MYGALRRDFGFFWLVAEHGGEGGGMGDRVGCIWGSARVWCGAWRLGVVATGPGKERGEDKGEVGRRQEGGPTRTTSFLPHTLRRFFPQY